MGRQRSFIVVDFFGRGGGRVDGGERGGLTVVRRGEGEGTKSDEGADGVGFAVMGWGFGSFCSGYWEKVVGSLHDGRGGGGGGGGTRAR